jgi:hypothetical protein
MFAKTACKYPRHVHNSSHVTTDEEIENAIGAIKGFTELNNDLNVKTNEFNKLR